ncbi:hypothetical protein FHS90_001756 [Rufibacter quisquiliarum]|uniref:Uncharacterized protein n=1 Tax=Rufibacter quisquiliarum TaxID=1549639 RepID=A0A839GNB7_9BACT|nr:hypothetical protein [Rufibacter quisquiliarum]
MVLICRVLIVCEIMTGFLFIPYFILNLTRYFEHT